jgi:hypothetical protein
LAAEASIPSAPGTDTLDCFTISGGTSFRRLLASYVNAYRQQR